MNRLIGLTTLALWSCASSLPEGISVNIEQDPMPHYLGGDSVVVHPWQLVFGSDPNMRVCGYPENVPNPFSPRSGLELINLTRDTLIISTEGDDENPGLELYREYLDRGYFVIRIYSRENMAGWHQIRIWVGKEGKATRAYFYSRSAN